MSKTKIKGLDLITDPPARIIKHSPTGMSKTLAGTIKGPPWINYNPHSKRYEVVVEFMDPDRPDGEKYRLTADQLDWEKLIADVQKAFKEIPT